MAQIPTTAATPPPNQRRGGRNVEPNLFRFLLIAGAILLAAGSLRAWFSPAWTFDFFGLWSFARFAQTHAGAIGAIYDPAQLQRFQETLAPGWQGFFPFPYPPSFLWLIAWIGRLPFGLAKLLWTAAGAAAMAASLALLFTPPWRRCAILLPFIGVAALQNFLNGETGFFTSASLIAGFTLLPRRPLIAGLIFGLLTAKPQLCVLIACLLPCIGAGRAFAGFCAAALTLAAATCLAFGPAIWFAWLRFLPVYGALAAANRPNLAHLMVSVPAALPNLPAPLVWLSAGLVAMSVTGLTCLAFRSAHVPPPLATSMALAAIPLAAPHSLIYDTPELSAAMLLAAEYLFQRHARISPTWLALFGWVGWVEPGFISRIPAYPITVLSEILLFSAIARLAFRA